MVNIKEKQDTIDLRKKLSIELCNNFVKRLDPLQDKETKLGALIAIKNLIKESHIYDPFLFSYLVDTLIDPDKEIRDMVIRVIKDVGVEPSVYPEIIELLEIKLQEANSETKNEINNLLQFLKSTINQ